MPELPEVEIIRLGLSKKLIGSTIKKIEVLAPKSFFGTPKKLLGKKVLSLDRRAKLLIVNLSGEISLLTHLKMTGQLIWISDLKLKSTDRFTGGHPTEDMLEQMPNKSTRVILTFSDHSKLFFNDQRRFGWVKQLPTSEVGAQKFLQALGPEPLDRTFNWQVLKQQLQKRHKTPVKVVIMDQSIIAGVGNIYACEACFLAKIDPRRKVSELTDTEYQRLHKGIVESLKAGIKHGGSSRTHFVNEEGEKGRYLDFAYVYDREGERCKVCGTALKKIRLGGRGTVFCPKCQD